MLASYVLCAQIGQGLHHTISISSSSTYHKKSYETLPISLIQIKQGCLAGKMIVEVGGRESHGKMQRLEVNHCLYQLPHESKRISHL